MPSNTNNIQGSPQKPKFTLKGPPSTKPIQISPPKQPTISPPPAPAYSPSPYTTNTGFTK